MLEEMGLQVLSLHDYPDAPDIDEDGETFIDNALKKARIVSAFTGEAVIADDSGLEVDALDGRPGVHSARYAGAGASDRENYMKLLEEMESVPPGDRAAAFRCVLVLFHPDKSYESFEGVLEGSISLEPSGREGFGYDPVFIVPEYGKTVAELSPEIKNRISHRARAFEKLKNVLKQSDKFIRC